MTRSVDSTTWMPGRTIAKRLLATFLLPSAVLASVVWPGVATAAAPEVTCGATVTVDTTLTKDLSCPSGDGVILGPNVVLDLGGHSIIGSGSAGVGVTVNGAGRNTIRHGKISNWGTGITDDSDSGTEWGISDVVLRNAPVHSLGTPLQMTRVTAVNSQTFGELSGNVTISDSKFTGSPIIVFGATATITRSTLTTSPVSTSYFGEVTIDASKLDGRGESRLGDVSETGITITNSTVKNFKYPISGYWGSATFTNSVFTNMPLGVLGNVSQGLGSEATAEIRGNVFVRSGVVLDPHIPMILENNTFIQNKTGAIFADPANSRAVGNVLVKNSGTGLKSEQPGLPVGNNTAIFNGGYGIDTPGAIDLGGNIAYGNKLGQCVGVVCAGK
jgi:hypothetical protein